jgi:allantoinase
MAGRTVVRGGTVVTEAGEVRADLLIEGERIVGLLEDTGEIAADHRIEARGLLVLPGAIDIHTHFEEPDPNLLEGFTTGGQGAAAGGITTVVEMPQAHPTTVTAAQLREKIDLVGRNAIVDMALWAGVIGEPEQPSSDLGAMAAAGAAGFKSFMASSSPFFPAVDDAKLYHAMRAIAPLGLPYGLHAEDAALLEDGLRQTQGAGRTDAAAHAESRPPLVEEVAVNAALLLGEKTGCHVHLCHVGSAGALRLIAAAKARGQTVTCETCPQYLALTTEDLDKLKGFARCAPALREPAEVEAIWPFLLDGTIDLVCSDHCGFTAESKQPGETDIFAVPLGLSGIQTLVPVLYDAAVVRRGLPLAEFVRLLAGAPARIFGLWPRKGTIAVGSDADLTLLDPAGRWTVRAGDLVHRQRWTPFEGRELAGRVVRTIRRGETIYDHAAEGPARLPAAPGSGRFLARGYGAAG